MISLSGDKRLSLESVLPVHAILLQSVRLLVRENVLVLLHRRVIDRLTVLARLHLQYALLLLRRKPRTWDDWSKAWNPHTFLRLMTRISASYLFPLRPNSILFFSWESEIRLFFWVRVFRLSRMQEVRTKPFLICDFRIVRKIDLLGGYCWRQASILLSFLRSSRLLDFLLYMGLAMLSHIFAII